MMESIRELAERCWEGKADLVHDCHPVHAKVENGEEVADGVLVFKGTASANVIDTGDGLVMLDTGSQYEAEQIHTEVRKWRRDAPLVAAVFSHHHVDHIFGTIPFEREAAERHLPAPVVYGHRDIGRNLDRYLRTRHLNTTLNRRQFAVDSPAFAWPDQYRYPDVTYEDRLTFRSGDLTFELHHARGETEDATWTWVPERKIVHPGDLFIWGVPNAGNPQKVQRYADEWAAALRQMAGLGAEILLAGHGMPIFGADRIRQALSDTAELLESLESQTLALMNQGVSLDRVIHEVQVPEHLREQSYLQAVYDHPQFIVRNIWRRYGGWYDGEPDNLLPAPRSQQAREWVDLAGGIDAVLNRVAALRDEGDLRLAGHLVEFAVLADPASANVHDARAEVFAARAEEQTSSMARNILNHAAQSSRAGLRDLASERPFNGAALPPTPSRETV
jgi:alkyl sulfatase BDS1-like metallo-beta-lactamase superfamily hydrolase